MIFLIRRRPWSTQCSNWIWCKSASWPACPSFSWQNFTYNCTIRLRASRRIGVADANVAFEFLSLLWDRIRLELSMNGVQDMSRLRCKTLPDVLRWLISSSKDCCWDSWKRNCSDCFSSSARSVWGFRSFFMLYTRCRSRSHWLNRWVSIIFGSSLVKRGRMGCSLVDAKKHCFSVMGCSGQSSARLFPEMVVLWSRESFLSFVLQTDL